MTQTRLPVAFIDERHRPGRCGIDGRQLLVPETETIHTRDHPSPRSECRELLGLCWSACSWSSWGAHRTDAMSMTAQYRRVVGMHTQARTLQTEGIAVCDVRPPKRASRAGKGKSDEIDAVAAARTALLSAEGTLAAPRADRIRSALRVLLVARRAIDSHRTAGRNMPLLRGFDLGVDARTSVTDAQVRSVAAW